MSTKLIANYLPQYHSIPENDSWWGKGYTDWVSVKNAKPLFDGHNQPRVPYNKTYYDLSDVNSIRWQAKVAREYGIEAFGIYHYWFSDDQYLLTKPAELLLENKDINIEFLFIWDNGTWKRTWSNVKGYANDWAPNVDSKEKSNDSGILAELKYGGKSSWKKHFEYLLPFFKDERYIKLDNKPVFCIFNQYNDEECINNMVLYWDALAKESGFSGVVTIGKSVRNKISSFDYEYDYEPVKHGWEPHVNTPFEKIINKIKIKLDKLHKGPKLYDYDMIWRRIIKDAENCIDEKKLFGCFVGYDDSPRRGTNGKVIINGNPFKFEKYLRRLLEISNEKNKAFLFITAWNEWGEGAYLEPDSQDYFGYLNAVKNCRE